LLRRGFTALLLSRRMFVRISALLQMAAFSVGLGGYFLEPTLSSPAQLAAAENQLALVFSPTYWSFALFEQLTGTLQPGFEWVARRAWIGLAVAAVGALGSLLMCYLRTMQKTVEEPHLVPASRKPRWTPRSGKFAGLGCPS